jgi:ectoine hydroxylase-related dioxygenase (phytanoyl-CoA dioxygenase family)
MLTAASPLTDAEVDRFWSDGFIRLPSLVDDESLAQLRARCDRVLRRDLACAGDRRLGDLIRQVMWPSRSDPGFVEHAGMRRAIDIGRQLLARQVAFTFDMLIVKEPGDLHETPWHQDWSYSERPCAPAGKPIPNTKLQFWVALDDAEVENGCLHFVPGAHRGRLREHVVAAGDPADDSRLLALRDQRGDGAVACPLPAGGCTIHVEGTPHYAGGNRTADRRRRAFIFNLEPA